MRRSPLMIATPPPLPPIAAPPARPARAPRDALSVSLSAEGTVDGYAVTFSSMVGDFVVDPRAVHIDLADLAGSVRTPDVAHTSTSTVQSGPPGPTETVTVRLSIPSAALHVGMQQLVLRLDPAAVRRHGAPATLPAFKAPPYVNVDVPERTSDADVARRLVGKDVAVYGPLELACGLRTLGTTAKVVLRPGSRLRVASVRRERGTAALLGLGSGAMALADTAFRYKAIDPLRVTFDTSVRPSIAGQALRAGTREQADAGRSEMMGGGCQSLTLAAADAWDLDRLLAPVPAAALAGPVRPGLTHEQVALALGFPSVYATKTDLLARPVWRYDMPAPFSSTVTFADDRVVRYDPPGNLP